MWQTPGVIRDFQISRNPLELADGDVRGGRCTTYRGIVTDCEARLVYSYNGRSYDSSVKVMFVDFHLGDYETGLVISADHPQLATLTLALDKLWNRIITLTLFAGGLFCFGFAMVFVTLRIWRVQQQLRRPALMTVIPVEITAFDRNRTRLAITYNDRIAADKTGRSAYTQMRNGQEPLIVGKADGKAVGLAIRHGNAALPVLLDSGLQRIALTEDERAAALAPFAGQAGAVRMESVLAQQAVKTTSIWTKLQLLLATLLLILVAIVGFWLWYVTASDTQFQSPGMDINNLMPAPLNRWGCEQLKKRFGQERAPFGCVAGDFTSWK